ncbi:hypothetical protein Pyn_07304 [Prunus yedoensis var. nudiflora]|uniref:Uncharacterized protein n=1 Tax=Prunus yedoensis var. nudiflora TaxID=2094558 RepID=A0A314XS13_PRUYE|nr:hypothetical protein Pyn_07304 [Prunus yedoensis var. nudiflora]
MRLPSVCIWREAPKSSNGGTYLEKFWQRRHMGVFIVAWLEQHVGCVVTEKGILHASQALFRPRDEGLPPIRIDFLVDLLIAQNASRSVTKW